MHKIYDFPNGIIILGEISLKVNLSIHKQFNKKYIYIWHTPTLRSPFNSFCEGEMTTNLVAFFIQTIKEMFCNILKCSFRFFRVFSLYHCTWILV